jgi:hypothetical protein
MLTTLCSIDVIHGINDFTQQKRDVIVVEFTTKRFTIDTYDAFSLGKMFAAAALYVNGQDERARELLSDKTEIEIHGENE